MSNANRLIALMLGFVSIPSFAAVVEKQAQQWYAVQQSADTSLLMALIAASPVKVGGRTFHGYTAWDIRWNFRWNTSAAGLCEISSITTHLSVTMTLPRLASSTPKGAADFDRYFAALMAHEQGHRSIALEAARQVDRTIAGLQPMADCRRLEAEANAAGMAILEEAKRRELDYDITTRQGCTQGACLAR